MTGRLPYLPFGSRPFGSRNAPSCRPLASASPFVARYSRRSHQMDKELEHSHPSGQMVMERLVKLENTLDRRSDPRHLIAGLVLLVAFLCGPPCFAKEPDEQNTSASAFLNTYCIDCHNADDASGQRDLESLSLSKSDSDTLILLKDVIDQLTLGEMPPEDAEQPSTDERRIAIEQLTHSLRKRRAEYVSTDRQTVLRRLSRREYLATIGDLFQMNMLMFDPTERFPTDQTVEHLDNVGDTLIVSGYLLDQYLEAADRIVEKALPSLERPSEQTWRFDGNFKQQPELNSAHKEAFGYRYLCLYDSPLADRPEGAYGPIHDFEHGVPHDGNYRIRVRAQALHRDTPYSESDLRIDLSEKFRLGIRPGNIGVGSLHNSQPIQPLLAQQTIQDDQVRWYTMTVHLDRGFTPRFTFENGLREVRPLHTRLHRKYKQTLPQHARSGSGIVRGRKVMLRYGQVPQVRIHEIEITGPLHPEWPSPAIASVLPQGNFDEPDAKSVIARFASRAYRRPLRDGELDRLMKVYRARRSQGRDSFSAMKDTLKTVLCSPSFLYLLPDCDADDDRLSQHALAARLSYFLTGSMPDETLRSIADSGGLDNETLVQQTRRLLGSPRSDAMIAGFTDAWLNLRALGEMPPDRDAFWRYYASNLEPRNEARDAGIFSRPCSPK